MKSMFPADKHQGLHGRHVLPPLRRMRRWLRKLRRDERGTTSLEWALLIGGIALPGVYLFTMCLSVIVDYYRMMTMIGSFSSWRIAFSTSSPMTNGSFKSSSTSEGTGKRARSLKLPLPRR